MKDMVVNHLIFADDICVFSPSISGLQCLLNICGDYPAEHEITFNCNKTIGNDPSLLIMGQYFIFPKPHSAIYSQQLLAPCMAGVAKLRLFELSEKLCFLFLLQSVKIL